MGATNDRFVLRDLSLPTRLVLSCFLISVGIGYFSALVQLHFAGGAKAGEPLPDRERVTLTYGNRSTDQAKPTSHLERVLSNTEGAFNGAGTMAPAFTSKSRSDWDHYLEKLEKEHGKDAVPKLLADREGERRAMIAWVQTANAQYRDFKRAYDQDKFVLPAELASRPITLEYLVTTKVEENGKEVENPVTPRAVKIKSLFENRCIDCHAEDGRNDKARDFPFDELPKLKPYLTVKAGSSGMSLTKLAQTTHVHLLAFSMLYGLTGLLFSLTSFPALVRYVIAPLALLAQLGDISCWWLARFHPDFAAVIQITGGIVALSLVVQILGSLFDMYAGRGKMVMFVLVVAGALGAGWVHQTVIGPYLEQERAAAAEKQ